MEAKTATGAKPKTEEEYIREIDQMAIEIRAMLDEAGRRTEHARRIGRENRRILNELEKKYLCSGND